MIKTPETKYLIIYGGMAIWMLIREFMHWFEMRNVEKFARNMLNTNIQLLEILEKAGIAMPAKAMNDE